MIALGEENNIKVGHEGHIELPRSLHSDSIGCLIVGPHQQHPEAVAREGIFSKEPGNDRRIIAQGKKTFPVGCQET